MLRYKNTRIGISKISNNFLFVKGNFMPWFVESENCLSKEAPIEFINMNIEHIDDEGMFLEMIGDNWTIEVDGEFINSEILKKWRNKNDY